MDFLLNSHNNSINTGKFSTSLKVGVWVATVLSLLVDTNFSHRLTDLHLSKLIMEVLTFPDVSKFSNVNAANNAYFANLKMHTYTYLLCFTPSNKPIKFQVFLCPIHSTGDIFNFIIYPHKAQERYKDF